MIRSFLRVLFGCWHPEGLIREDRTVDRVSVRGFGCAVCGHWEPQVQRTTAERRRLLKVIAAKTAVTRQPKANVTPMPGRRRA